VVQASSLLLVSASSLLLGSQLLAAEFLYETAAFNLGPGEVAPALTLPRFNPTEHPDTPVLERVQVTLEVAFTADISLAGLPSKPGPVAWRLGPARVSVWPVESTLVTPGSSSLSLAGTATLPATGRLVLDPAPRRMARGTLLDAVAGVNGFAGFGAMTCEVQFEAGYSWLTTEPELAGAFYANDRVSGRLQVVYTAQPEPLSPGRPVLTARRLGSGSSVRLEVVGRTGASVVIESAEQILGPWTSVAEVRLDAGGTGGFVLEPEPTSAVRFYRVQAPAGRPST
jgi:hypothetical protein